MKQIYLVLSLFIILNTIPSLLFSNSEGDNDLLKETTNNDSIFLPKIPIYVEGNSDSFTHPSFIKVYSKNDAFYTLKIEKIKTTYKKYNRKATEHFISGMFKPGWLLLGICIDGIVYLFSYVEGKEYYDDEGEWQYESQYYSEPFRLTFTLISSLYSGFRNLQKKGKLQNPTPIYNTYYATLFSDNEITKSSTIKVNHLNNDLNFQLNHFFNKSNNSNFNRLQQIAQILKQYYKEIDLSLFHDDYRKEISRLNFQRGEFETTNQFNERIKKEQIRKNELNAEMEQEISILKEKREIERFALLQEIKKEISEIEFTKFFDFEISNYNADRQTFTFNISGTEKEVIVSLMKAPNFKENISDYKIQKIFRPTLQGKWEVLSDDFILKNSKTNDIIHWEGSLPTSVKTAVENPPILSASVKLVEPSGEGYLDADETSTIQVTLTNSGKSPAKMTRISLFQEDGPILYYDVSNTIKEILPNKTIKTEFNLTVPENIKNERVKFKISFLEEQGFEPTPLTFTAETREMSKPDLRFIDFGIDDSTGDGKLSKGETADITIRIQNIGQGKAKQVAFNIIEDHLDNVFIISEKQFKLGNFNSGESKDITFSISTNNRVNDLININFNIQEERPQFSINEKITLEIEKTQKQLKQIVFAGKNIEKQIEYSDDLSIDIEQNIPISNKSSKNALAIIFGIENYRNVSNVNFAFRDATIMKEYFSNTIGIPKEQIYFRANDEVTLGEFRKIFSKNGWLDKRVIENKTDIYFYYAGHGAPAIKEEKAFLIPFDGDPNYPVQTGYSLEAVFENLSKLNANSVTVFLDACFTGANRENEMLLAGARPVSIQLKNNYVNNVTVFSATSNNEISSSYPKNKHGLFSYFLMKGMQGKADTNKDNKLTINELFDYTKKNVSRIAGTLDREQTPQLECLEPEKIIINY